MRENSRGGEGGEEEVKKTGAHVKRPKQGCKIS